MAAQAPNPDKAASRRELQRSDQILDRALPLFLELGYSGTSMSMIACAVGGSKATLYRYFPDKEQLFLALMERTWNHHADEPGPTGRPERAVDAHAWLSAWATDYLHHLYEDDMVALHRLIIAEAARFPELGARLYVAGPCRGILALSDALSVLHQRQLITCNDPLADARAFRALAKAGHYEERLWSAGQRPSKKHIRADASLAADVFLRAYPPPLYSTSTVSQT